MFNKKITIGNNIFTILLILFFVACIIMFWYFLLNTTFLAALYPRLCVGITAHLGLVYISFWYYLALKERSVIEQFNLWFKKKNSNK